MKKFGKNLVKFFLGKTWGQLIFKQLYLFSLKAMNFGGGVNPEDSGEAQAAKYAIKKLGKDSLRVFDVGGNRGEYTKMWLKLAKKYKKSVEIFIFEPSTFALKVLNEEFSANQSVRIIKTGVGESDSEAVLYADKPGSGLGSLIKRDLRHVNIALASEEKIIVRSLDGFCTEQKIEKIDFLKLDIEGFELAALKGAKKLITDHKISFIQFEFGGTDIDTRVFFKDFFLLLNSEYRIYRILKNGIWPIEAYSELEEVFLTTNYLAERR